MRPKDTLHFTLNFTMTKDVLTALLAKGKTGDEILAILDTIADGSDDNDIAQNAPTLNTIDF